MVCSWLRAFANFVLAQCVKQGLDEPDVERLSPLLRLTHRALSKASDVLGKPNQVRGCVWAFSGTCAPSRPSKPNDAGCGALPAAQACDPRHAPSGDDGFLDGCL